jgi:hypothetical protein
MQSTYPAYFLCGAKLAIDERLKNKSRRESPLCVEMIVH